MKKIADALLNPSNFKHILEKKLEFLEFVSNSLKRGNSTQDLIRASMASIDDGDHKAFYEKIFGSYESGDKYIEELKNAKDSLYEKFPILNLLNIQANNSLSKFKVIAFFENFYLNLDIVNEKNIDPQLKVAPEIVCGSYWQQVKLAACSGICGAATAGAGSVLCLWGCWCMLCTEILLFMMLFVK